MKRGHRTTEELRQLGWREWIALPDLGIERIKAKVDTGARTSCLHAFFLERYRHEKRDWVRFHVHPMQNDKQQVVECAAPLLDLRQVSDSGGHLEQRCVIETTAVVYAEPERIELTLTDRDSMRFRMLLGRTALGNRYLVNPAASFVSGPIPDRRY